MGAVLDRGLLLCRLPKGVLGEDTVRVLGSLVVARVWQAATARASQPESSRRDATLYVDECHNFLNLPGSVADMLAEARGYRLSLVLAHQDLPNSPKTSRPPRRRTPATRSTSPSTRKTPATWPRTLSTTWPTWTSTPPPRAWSSPAGKPPRSPSPPASPRPRPGTPPASEPPAPPPPQTLCGPAPAPATNSPDNAS
jgi:hypothetical protein